VTCVDDIIIAASLQRRRAVFVTDRKIKPSAADRTCSLMTGCYHAEPGAQPRLKSWGGPRFGSQHWPGWVLGAGGVAPSLPHPTPAVMVRGYHPRKIFENSDAKSCILVTTCCDISCFLKTTAKKLGDQYIVGPPNLKVGDQLPLLPTVFAPMRRADMAEYSTRLARRMQNHAGCLMPVLLTGGHIQSMKTATDDDRGHFAEFL